MPFISRQFRGDGPECAFTRPENLPERVQTDPCGGYGRKTGNNDLRVARGHRDTTREVILPPKAKELETATEAELGRFPSWQ